MKVKWATDQLYELAEDSHGVIIIGEKRISLTMVEGRLIRFLAQRAPAYVTRQEILAFVWAHRAPPLNKISVEVLIGSIRKKTGMKDIIIKGPRYGDGYSLSTIPIPISRDDKIDGPRLPSTRFISRAKYNRIRPYRPDPYKSRKENERLKKMYYYYKYRPNLVRSKDSKMVLVDSPGGSVSARDVRIEKARKKYYEMPGMIEDAKRRGSSEDDLQKLQRRFLRRKRRYLRLVRESTGSRYNN